MARILVIDDEEDVLRALKRRFEREGWHVDLAESASEAISKLSEAEHPYDVVVTDMSMEDPQAGVRVLQAAFARDLFAQVIVMTAYGQVANAVECMKRGAFDYIEKNRPGEDVYEVLVGKIYEALDVRRRDIRTIGKWERAAEFQRARRQRRGAPA
ncbi:MAG: response regulator [Fimbriimonadales bacterium]|nr:response regulator [Fimbriimonadales bacterium]